MASTPSASALSAVLRCRGNIFNQANKKRPSHGSGYSLGAKCGAAGEPAASDPGVDSRQLRLGWRALLFGEHAEARDGISVVIRWELLSKVVTDRSGDARASDRSRQRLTWTRLSCSRSAAAPTSDGRRGAELCNRGARSVFSETVLFALGLGKGTASRETRNDRLAGAALGQSVPKTCLFVQCLVKSKGFASAHGPPVIFRDCWVSLKIGCTLLTTLLSEVLRRRLIIADGSQGIQGAGKAEVDDQRAAFASRQDPSSSYTNYHTVIDFKGRRRPASLEAEERSLKPTSCPRSSTVSGK